MKNLFHDIPACPYTQSITLVMKLDWCDRGFLSHLTLLDDPSVHTPSMLVRCDCIIHL